MELNQTTCRLTIHRLKKRIIKPAPVINSDQVTLAAQPGQSPIDRIRNPIWFSMQKAEDSGRCSEEVRPVSIFRSKSTEGQFYQTDIAERENN